MTIATLPLLDQVIDLSPTPEIEVPDAEIRSLRQGERFAKRWQECSIDVVEDARHSLESPYSRRSS